MINAVRDVVHAELITRVGKGLRAAYGDYTRDGLPCDLSSVLYVTMEAKLQDRLTKGESRTRNDRHETRIRSSESRLVLLAFIYGAGSKVEWMRYNADV